MAMWVCNMLLVHPKLNAISVAARVADAAAKPGKSMLAKLPSFH
jgi:hypothetical protein